MTESKRPKIGLALGSGGSRGLAHIGVIKVLEENNIPIDFIAGSSIGALVGGFYAVSLNIKEIEKLALSINWRRIFSVLFDPHLKQGLIGGEKLKTFIENYINGKKFKEFEGLIEEVNTQWTKHYFLEVFHHNIFRQILFSLLI